MISSKYSSLCLLVVFAITLASTTMSFTCAQQVNTTTTAATTTTTSSGTIPITRFTVVGMGVKIEYLASPADKSMLQVTFTSDVDPFAGKYYSIGKSEGYMTGSLIACSFPFSSVPSTCVNMNGQGYGADKAATQSVVLVSSTAAATSLPASSSTVSTVVIQIPTAYFFGSIAPSAAGMQRWIFARGGWKSDNGGKPGGHDDHFAQIGIDFSNGAVQQPDDRHTPNTNWAIFRAWLATMLMGLIGVAIQQTERFQPASLAINIFRHPTVTFAFRIITWVVIVSCALGVFITSFNEFNTFFKVSPFGRALGATALYIFSLLFMPTTRYLNVGVLAGGQYEQFISWHVAGGISIYIIVSLHFFSMLVSSASVGFGSVIFSAGDGVQKILCAFFGWLFLTAMVVFAAFRNTKKSKIFKHYYFKIAHCLFPLVILLFMLHIPTLGLCILPGLLLWIGDVVLRFLRTRQQFYNPKLREIEVDRDAQVTKLVIEYTPDANDFKYLSSGVQLHQLGGSYFAMSFEGMKGEFIAPHPFSVAYVDQEGSNHKMFFYVRNTMATSGSSASLAVTNQIYTKMPDRWVNDKSQFRQFIGPMGSCRIDELLKSMLARTSTSSLKDSAYAAAGEIQNKDEKDKKDAASPEGSPKPVEPKNTFLFVCGGIGVTAMLGLLQSLVLTAKVASSQSGASDSSAAAAGAASPRVGSTIVKALEKLTTVVFVWSVREQSLINMILPKIESICREAQGIAGSKFKIYPKIFVTTGRREIVDVTGGDETATAPENVITATPGSGSSSASKYASPSSTGSRGRRGGAAAEATSPIVTIETGRRIGDHDLYPENVVEPTNYFCFSCGPPALNDFVKTSCEKQKADNSSAYVKYEEEVFEY